MLTAVVMAAVVILVACGSDSKNGRKKNSADNSDENLTLYYANSTWTDLFPEVFTRDQLVTTENLCLLYTSPSPRDGLLSRMPSSA